MTVYATVDGSYAGDVASTGGWSAAAVWLHNQSGVLREFAAEPLSEDSAAVGKALSAAIEAQPPADIDVADTLRALAALLAASTGTFAVTDGLGTEGGEAEPTKSACAKCGRTLGVSVRDGRLRCRTCKSETEFRNGRAHIRR